ncbi:MAG: alpha-ketoacid dehydrogenase subunit beta [Phycisphaerae bacterium]|jgi:pyruvate/2-oxoglutarate/acetoin dehydrogenase E1 component|nr:alpha-ketoacid dehydrogenase subunit beta [Phycisphaerae bacterium]
MAEITYREAVRDAIAEEMRRDERVFVMGEDVAIYGGAYQATKGLLEEFGEERIRDTAISEAAISGAAVGAAMCGLRPVAEIMYVDFMTIAMDQFVNQAGKNRYMFGGKTTVPMVLRTEGGAGRSIAAHHSQSLEAWFYHAPGVFVVMPATPYDVKGLLKTCIRDDNPILFIEHKMLYGDKGEVPDEEYLIPLGEAAIRREGSDVTLVSYSRMALMAAEAAEALAGDGIDAEVIDLRSIKPLDIQAILKSVKKTGRLILVSEAYKDGNIVCDIAMKVNEFAFDYLDAPIERVCAINAPVPMSPVLEDVAIPRTLDIVAAAKRTLGK